MIYNPNICDSNSELENDNYEFLFVYSSKKCKHSKKLINELSKTDLNPNIKIIPVDIIELYKQNKPIPDYIDYVPALIFSDINTRTAEEIKYGNEIYEWVKDNSQKKSFHDNDKYPSRNLYGNVKYKPLIKTNKNGQPIDKSPAQFQIADVKNDKKNSLDDLLNKYNEEYSSLNAELGHQNQVLYDGGDDDNININTINNNINKKDNLSNKKKKKIMSYM
jgi:hypothetical protein